MGVRSPRTPSLPPRMRAPSVWMGCQLTTPSLDPPVSNGNAEGLAHQGVGLDGLAEECPVVPHAAQVVHAAVHEGCGLHDGATLPQGAVRLIEKATVVRAEVQGLGGGVALGTVVDAARVAHPLGVVDPPALSQVQDRHGWPAIRAQEVVQRVFIVVPTEPTRGVYIGAGDGNGGVVLAVKRH